ncbi:1,6-anhydro-N-acetylmuramyl-L-alanine amidase AmpD [Gammaproteobacteria bacterium]|nr:1,6-anhydro-N-acetylmuramyl-L-alanine amidase AmpD [Gammaproteobacteria bacterium]|tara:strand:+ start:1678 stop:2226 length:549 start_codon:yes stop_codon:yes gene_type:complete
MSIINIKDNLIEGVTFHSSPNFDSRPKDTDISLIVIHSISLPPGKYGGNEIKDFFLNELDTSNHEYFESIKNLKVSSHIVIKRTGEILQFVPFNKRAWHAGISSYLGKENCNDYSIGIELEGTDDSEFTDEQYNSLINLTSSLIRSYPNLSEDRLVGHSDIAPGRKSDPGIFFDWKRFIVDV